jgi:hypothetical protein
MGDYKHYDRSGRYIGSSRERDDSWKVPLVVVAIAIALIAGLIFALILGVKSTVNLVRHGKFTQDAQEAELWENRNNPNFFTQYAKRAKISVKVVKYGADNGLLFADIRIANGSNRIHGVQLSSFSLEVSYLDNREWNPSRQTASVSLACSSEPTPFEIAPHSARVVHFSDCSDTAIVRYDSVRFLRKPSKPTVEKIDGYPTTGGPPNRAGYS